MGVNLKLVTAFKQDKMKHIFKAISTFVWVQCIINIRMRLKMTVNRGGIAAEDK